MGNIYFWHGEIERKGGLRISWGEIDMVSIRFRNKRLRGEGGGEARPDVFVLRL